MPTPPHKEFFEFDFSRPTDGDHLSPIARLIYAIGALASQATEVKRTYCDHPDGRPENDAEHSYMLSLVAQSVAREFFPELNSGLVAEYANIHELVELYVGDTPTHDISDGELLSKQKRESLGIEQLCSEYSGISPALVELVRRYEKQEEPEARLVYVLDKMLTTVTQFPNKGVHARDIFKDRTVRERTTQKRIERYAEGYPDRKELLAVYGELVEFLHDMAWPETVTQDGSRR